MQELDSLKSDTGRESRVLRVLCANIQAGATTRRPLDYIVKGWNVWLPFGKSGTLSSIAQVARLHDLVGLQEADGGSLRSGFACQAKLIGKMAHLPHASRQVNRELGPIMASGNALLGRFEPVVVHSLPLPSKIPGRGIMLAEYALENGETLSVIVAHLSLSAAARVRQLQLISALLSRSQHCILMGDLNTPASSPEMGLLFAHTPLRYPEHAVATYPAWRPSRAIDHILVGGGIACSAVVAVSIGGSDHLALSATLLLPSPIASQWDDDPLDAS